MVKEMEIGAFVRELSSKAPVPGGGGASALAGALGGALGQMVGNLTVGKKKYAAVEDEIREILARLQEMTSGFLELADQDEAVFKPLAQAYAMPKNTPQEQEEKARVMEERLLDAAMVPLRIMEEAVRTMELLEVLAKKGSVMAVSDVGVAVQFARTALLGGVMNVYINTKSMNNRSRAQELNAQAGRLVTEGTALADRIYGEVLKGLAN